MQRSESHKQLTLAKYIGLGLCAHMKTRSGADNECLGQSGRYVKVIHVYTLFTSMTSVSLTLSIKNTYRTNNNT